MLFSSSESWGGGVGDYGKYAVKIYTIDGVLIYQVENGTTNNGKSPKGGAILQSSSASSMMTTITNPITFYGNWGAVINQAGHSGDLYDYYWTSYSRGTDGRSNPNNTNWHNAYLDGYIPLRVKSIYDPCPYLYRIPSNGTYNQFKSNPGWTHNSYLGGVIWNMNTLGTNWFTGLGCKPGYNGWMGNGYFWMSTTCNISRSCRFVFRSSKVIEQNSIDARSHGLSVRCIEEVLATVFGQPDRQPSR